MTEENSKASHCPTCHGPLAPFLDQNAAAAILGLSLRTLERFRLEGRGPVYRKFGRRCLYGPADLLVWADAQRRSSTSDKGPAPTQLGHNGGPPLDHDVGGSDTSDKGPAK